MFVVWSRPSEGIFTKWSVFDSLIKKVPVGVVIINNSSKYHNHLGPIVGHKNSSLVICDPRNWQLKWANS